MEKLTAQNYPLAAKSVRKGLLMKDLMTSNYNEQRFLSRKPFIVNMERKDSSSQHVLLGQEEPRTEPVIRAKPLRGYLNQ